MASISTHVLDAAAGGPRAGVAVTVTDDRGGEVASGTTDAAGRVADLARDLTPGTYTIAWATGGSFVQAVSVTVTVADDRHLHVPLLVSPVAATAYLGV